MLFAWCNPTFPHQVPPIRCVFSCTFDSLMSVFTVNPLIYADCDQGQTSQVAAMCQYNQIPSCNIYQQSINSLPKNAKGLQSRSTPVMLLAATALLLYAVAARKSGCQVSGSQPVVGSRRQITG